MNIPFYRPLIQTAVLLGILLMFNAASCKRSQGNNSTSGTGNPSATLTGPDITLWLTKPDKSVVFQKQNTAIKFGDNTPTSAPIIEVDTSQTFQTIDGFGYTLTGG